MADNSRAADAVFNTPELLTLILAHLPFSTLLKTTTVSTNFRTTILTTPSLQRTLFLLPSLPSALSALDPKSASKIKLNPYFQSAFPVQYPGINLPHWGYIQNEPDCQVQGLLREREGVRMGPKTDFPFMRESRSWRGMVVLDGQVQITILRVREKVDVRSYFRSYDNWMGRWVRDRVLTFEDGMRCGDFWDLGKGVDVEMGGVGEGRRVVRLVCRPKIEGEVRDRATGLALDIKPDRWDKVSWSAWFWCLLGKKMDWKGSTLGGCLWVLLGGGRKRLGGKAVRESGRLVCEKYLTLMKDGGFVLDITIKPEESRWKHWKFWSWWEQQIKVRRLEQMGFVREADRKPGECPHW